MKAPEPLEIEAAEVQWLIDQARRGALDGAAQQRLVPLLRTLLWLQYTLLETRIGLSRLRRLLFGKTTEKRPRKPQDPDTGADGGGKGAGDSPDPDCDPGDPAQDGAGTPPGAGSGEANSDKPAGHGRRGAADYPGAETVFCPHDEVKAGDRCPRCERGRLYRLAALVRLRIVGQAPGAGHPL
jgi:hypothetical protein